MTENKNRNRINDNCGFTLIEVMVAITIMIIVILPLASFYAASLSTIQRSMLYSQGLQLARERMEFCEGLEYESLKYWNPSLTPGFEIGPQINTNRDPDRSDDTDIYRYDPVVSDLSNSGPYPIPIYRDYYDNSTGLLIDPNYNGLCDDDLDGDGLFGVIDNDLDDIAIANPDGDNWIDTYGIDINDMPLFMQSFLAEHGGNATFFLQKAGDGLYDTVVEGIYANSFDPWLFGTRHLLRGDDNLTEEVSPIIDFSLLFNAEQDISLVGQDYRHREQTFRTFARMTTIIDPTPDLADPNVGHVDAYADDLYLFNRIVDDAWTAGNQLNFWLCRERDMSLSYSIDSRSVGIDRQGFTDAAYDVDYTQTRVNPFTHNYTTPMYGKKVIVTVFFLSGEGEQEDLNEDGFPDGETFDTSNNVRIERIFYNSNLYGGLVGGMYPPVPRYDDVFYDDYGHLRHLIVDLADDTDPCSWENFGLPYLDDDWPGNL